MSLMSPWRANSNARRTCSIQKTTRLKLALIRGVTIESPLVFLRVIENKSSEMTALGHPGLVVKTDSHHIHWWHDKAVMCGERVTHASFECFACGKRKTFEKFTIMNVLEYNSKRGFDAGRNGNY